MFGVEDPKEPLPAPPVESRSHTRATLSSDPEAKNLPELDHLTTSTLPNRGGRRENGRLEDELDPRMTEVSLRSMQNVPFSRWDFIFMSSRNAMLSSLQLDPERWRSLLWP